MSDHGTKCASALSDLRVSQLTDETCARSLCGKFVFIVEKSRCSMLNSAAVSLPLGRAKTRRQNRCRCRRRYRCCHQYNPGQVYTQTDKIGVGPGGDIGGTDISCNLYGQAVHGADRTKLSGRVRTCSAYHAGVFIEGVAGITPTCRWSSR
jgi:hypothetical protein